MSVRNPQPITGTKTRLATTPNGAAFDVVPGTQLISARFNQPRQWLITVMQPVTGRSGVNPWVSTFDGTTPYPPGTGVMTAPNLPVGTSLQLALRWGAGGVAFQTAFDYPFAGGAFGVTADTLDLNVQFRGLVPQYAALDLVPVVGAFMVPGVASDPVPLRWRELDPLGLTGFVDIGAGSDAFFAVKPYSRRVRIASPDATVRYRVEFLDTSGLVLWSERINIAAIGAAGVFDVPAQAAVMRVVNNGVASVWCFEWEIGLV